MEKKSSRKTKGKTEENAVPEAREYRGLCSSCNHAPTCTYIRDDSQLVLQCEEFENHEESPIRTADEASSSKINVSASFSAEEDSGEVKGLCVDCKSRETCIYPKPEGGVWHCEEYQ